MIRIPKTGMSQLFLMLLSLMDLDPSLAFWAKIFWIASQLMIAIGWKRLRGLAIVTITLSLCLYWLRPKEDL